MDLLSATVIEQLNLGSNMGLMIRWQTIPESIEQQILQVQAIAKQLDLVTSIYQDELEEKLWQNCAELTSVTQSQAAVTCKIGIAPAATVGLLKQIGDYTHSSAMQSESFRASPSGTLRDRNTAAIHAASGIGKIQLKGDYELVAQMRSHCQQNQGFLTILDAPQAVKQQIDIWGYSGNAIKTMQAIKNQFDPQNILNPGRFIV
jgi:glycolate oxidase FAD binding subunit